MCLTLIVTASLSFYVLWIVDSGDEDRTRTVGGEVPSTHASRRRFQRVIDAPTSRRNASRYFYYGRWTRSAERTCSGRLIGYGRLFAVLKNVVIDKKYCQCRRLGGEPIHAVLNQEESDEYYNVDVGCFQLPCARFRSYFFHNESKHLNAWISLTLCLK